MKILTIIKKGVTYEALKVNKNNLNEIEWFTSGQIKCVPENLSSSGKTEIWCYKGEGVFSIFAGDYFLKDAKGRLDVMTEIEFEEFPVLPYESKPNGYSIWNRFKKLFDCRR
jgi:hypothetical protein